MKAISLWEPSATLVAIGAKRWETRSWKTHYRGQICIHASIKKGNDITFAMMNPRVQRALGEHKLAFGCIVAIAEITDCITTEEWARRYITPRSNHAVKNELAFGEYGPFRYAWKLSNIRRIGDPVPMKGARGFFHVPSLILNQCLETALSPHK